MPRSGRPAIDDSGMWTTDVNNFTIGEAYYLKTDLPASDDYVVKNLAVASSLKLGATTYTAITIWGSGLISLGLPTPNQMAAFAAGTVAQDGKGFPGEYISFGPLDANHQDIFAAYDASGQLNIAFVTGGPLAEAGLKNTPGLPNTSSMNIVFGTDRLTFYSGTALAYPVNAHTHYM